MSLQLEGVNATPFNVTVLDPWEIPKYVPLIEMFVPANAVVGLTEAIFGGRVIMVQFNEPVDAAKLNGVTLTVGSGAVNVSQITSIYVELCNEITEIPTNGAGTE